MGCIENKKSPAESGSEHDYNAFDAMEPRLPGKTPVERRNGKHVKANDIPPEGVYLPNNNYLAPHMKSPSTCSCPMRQRSRSGSCRSVPAGASV